MARLEDDDSGMMESYPTMEFPTFRSHFDIERRWREGKKKGLKVGLIRCAGTGEDL
jgi:hypothetical protein